MTTEVGIEIWNGEEFITKEAMLEQEIVLTPTVTPKEELAKQILMGLLMGDPKVVGVEYHRVSSEVKKANDASQGPSLLWMVDKGYLTKCEKEGIKTFYMLTRKGVEFQEEKPDSDTDEEKKK